MRVDGLNSQAIPAVRRLAPNSRDFSIEAISGWPDISQGQFPVVASRWQRQLQTAGLVSFSASQ